MRPRPFYQQRRATMRAIAGCFDHDPSAHRAALTALWTRLSGPRYGIGRGPRPLHEWKAFLAQEFWRRVEHGDPEACVAGWLIVLVEDYRRLEHEAFMAEVRAKGPKWHEQEIRRRRKAQRTGGGSR
jgi:hypothetical protein